MNQRWGIRALRTASLATLSVAAGCYHFHAYQIGGPDGRELGNQPATEWQGRTLHGLFWGLLRHDLAIANSTLADGTRHGIEEVRVGTNLGYVLVSALTLGIWVPVDVSWRSARPPVVGGKL
jgi:hypothetical protein